MPSVSGQTRHFCTTRFRLRGRPGGGIEAGFTLIEMLVVLTVVGLLAVVAVARLSNQPGFVTHDEARAALAEALSQARTRSATSGQVVPVNLSALKLNDMTYAPAIGNGTLPLAWPDGSTSGGIVASKGKPLLAIDWMTGRVSDASH